MKNFILKINRTLAAKKKLFTLFFVLAASMGTMFAQTELVDFSKISLDSWGDGHAVPVVTLENEVISIVLAGPKVGSAFQWDNQVKITLTNVAEAGLDLNKEYQLSFTATASTGDCGGVTLRFFENNQLFYTDANYLDFSTSYNFESEWIQPEAVATNGTIVFAFGWDPAQTVTISKLSFKERSKPIDGKYQIGDLYYYLDTENYTAEVTSMPSDGRYSGDITIPATIEYNSVTYNVISIGRWAFGGWEDDYELKSVNIPNNVTNIGEAAFYGCQGLENVNIPNKVTSIGNAAFAGCAMTSVAIPDSVISIGEWAFAHCKSLTSVTVGNSVTSLEPQGIFYDCTNLTNVTIGNNVTSIGSYAFQNCSNLTSMTMLCETPPSLADDAIGCPNLTNIYVPCGTLDTFLSANGWHEYASIIKYEFPHAYLHLSTSVIIVSSEEFSVPVEDALTVAQAMAIAGALAQGAATTEKYEVVGYVTGYAGKNEDGGWAQYGNQNFWIVDDKSGTATSTADGALQVYQGKAEEKVLIGDRIKVKATLSNYNGTLETSKGGVVTFVEKVPRGDEPPTPVDSADVTFLPADFEGQGQATTLETPGGYVTQTKDGVTVSADNAYGHNLTLRIYKGANLTITSETELISKIVFQFYSTYTGDLETEINVNAKEWTTILGAQARIEKLQIYYDTVGGRVNHSSDLTICSETTMVLEAKASYGCHFSQWSDGNTDNPRIVNLMPDKDTTFTAEFAKNAYFISTATNFEEWGAAIGDTVALYLDKVQISATANYGYHFAHWDDGNTENPRIITITKDKNYIAIFEKNLYSISKLCNNEQGSISGLSQAEYLDIITIEAIPNDGYRFVQWSDGVRDNPRTLVVTQDTTFTAIFEQITSGKCGKDAYWQYSDNKLSIFGEGDMYNYTSTTIPWLLLSANIQNIEFASTITSIGAYAFTGLTNRKLTDIFLPQGLLSIGAHAFDGDAYLETIDFGASLELIDEYAFNGCTRVATMTCLASSTPDVGTNALTSISSYADLFVLNTSLKKYQVDPNWNRFLLKTVGANETTTSTDDVTVEPGDNTVTLTWPTDDNAASYTIQITKDGVVFCTLIFNGNGQLIGIAFAPSRDRQSQPLAAKQVANGLQFTVTGLNSATHYAFSLTAKDSQETVLASYTGEFTTTGVATAIDQITNDQSPSTNKIFRDGQIFILRGDKVYTVDGRLTN